MSDKIMFIVIVAGATVAAIAILNRTQVGARILSPVLGTPMLAASTTKVAA